ncbi:MAG TPA: LysM peptidoglycan-binding domain-containing protein [Mariprofundaceae bacterium]|nr:LysM peptidoglycan-binding domain-containing protein [Mariprofundaceae bacterium]
MKSRVLVAALGVVTLICALSSAPAVADNLAMPAAVTQKDIKPNLPQPYIVKKGDTLWDIANYFFKSPMKWMRIWEHNLYITNPDLIYPGNKIWFDQAKAKSGGLTTVRPHPEVHMKKVERLEPAIDPSLLVTALTRQDFIRPEAVKGVGYILDSSDERINYGANDHVYLKFDRPVQQGDRFDVFRTTEPIRDPATGKVIGILVNHLGQIEVTSQANGIARGLVTHAFEELSRGDRLKPARKIDTHIVPNYPATPVNGRILYIRNDATEAGQHQIVGIDLGTREGISAGSELLVSHAGRIVHDQVSDKAVALPEEQIGRLIVLAPRDHTSIALVTQSSRPISIGDAVHDGVQH